MQLEGGSRGQKSHVVRLALGESSTCGSLFPGDQIPNMKKLYGNAMLMTRDGKYAFPLTVLYSDTEDGKFDLGDIHRMLACHPGAPATKTLEQILFIGSTSGYKTSFPWFPIG